MNILSNRINSLSESETLAMTQKSRELQALGHNVINLSIGEPDFDTPMEIKTFAKNAIDDNYSHYTPVSGYMDLRQAICRKLKRDNDLDFKPEQIVVSNGAKQSLANVVLSLVNPGDEVIIPAPYWVSYKEIIKLAEAKAVYINAPIEQDFKITAQQVEAAITPKTKLFMFSSPCNPTGSVYTREELKSIAEVIAKHPNIYILADEIYELINFGGKHESIAQFDFIRDKVITVNGVSKGFAMTGWRIGYLAAPTFIAKACDKLQGQITSAPSSIAQRATLRAMECNPKESADVKNMLAAFRERRDLLISLLKDIPGIKTNQPQGAFYVFPDVSYYYGKSYEGNVINGGEDLCMYLLNTVFVALVSGAAFGDPNCVRFSYATSNENLIEAVKRIKEALGKLK
ncbi:MAG: pyridoxal phosphate-dependent aminotransferase [Bacteroidetes bacterium]|nr:pyridoxal phosphate-dependent aminotransferase [Bacteroidota bacterium]